MSSMPRKALSLLLCLMLAAPANAGVAAWMALSMVDGETVAPQVHEQGAMGMAQHLHDEMQHAHHAMQHGVHAHADPGTTPATGHESHDEADCNEHCVSCANHCSNLGILSDNVMLSGLPAQSSRLESGNLRSYSDLLYRPPICA